MSDRLPRPHRTRLEANPPTDDELEPLAAGTTVVRVHPLAGPHPQAWNELRAWGPTTSRFDQHTPPPRTHPTRRVAYVAVGANAVTGALAEFFQDAAGGIGPLALSYHHPAMTVFTLTGPVVVLDLDSGWVTRAGGNQAIRTGPRGCPDCGRGPSTPPIRRSPGWCTARRCGVPAGAWRCGNAASRAGPRPRTRPRTLADPALAVAVATAADQLATFPLP